MGFSVSGSFVVVVLGVFVAASTVYASGGNTVERLTDAGDDRTDRLDTVHDTEINITAVTVSNTGCNVTVEVNNTGSTALSLEKTTLLLDNSPQLNWRDGATVGGDGSTDLWLPGERLAVVRPGQSAAPDATTVVTKTGVTARRDTEGLSC
jgi:flagellar protein FlaF